MKISMFGTGYVGLITGASFAKWGNNVICVDIDEDKIKSLKEGEIPIYEPGLSDLVAEQTKKERLHFTTDLAEAVNESDIIFVAVGTPENHNGSCDLDYVFSVGETIAKEMKEEKLIITKSTIPPGTTHNLRSYISKRTNIPFKIANNPEFLAEGKALEDFQKPDRIIIGRDDHSIDDKIKELYSPITRTGRPLVLMTIVSSELTKYAANGLLATKISYMNQLSRLSDKIGADIKEVAEGIGLDHRIGPSFLQAGLGWGGSCFPKDIKALRHFAREKGINQTILDEVSAANNDQPYYLMEKVKEKIGGFEDKIITLYGIAFKPGTDDIREAPSLKVIKYLKNQNVKEIRAVDPKASINFMKEFPKITIYDDPYFAAKDSDLIILNTEWDDFRSLNHTDIQKFMRTPNYADLRNIHDPKRMREYGFNYISVGRQ